ncbi:MAG TPA: extracellular solute-binding protein [Actinocrinis sp.]|nr:extracellular solute-binding protein [Actinocrinis sp.]
MTRPRRIPGIAAALAASLTAAACAGNTGGSTQTVNGVDPYPASKPAVTIKLWDGFSQGSENDAFNAMVATFEKAHPNIHVAVTGNINDTQIQQGIKAGGSQSPDVAVSFTTDDVGTYCSTGEWINLKQDLSAAQIDVAKTFPSALVNYTQYQGDQCALPLENDAYGLYYNKALLTAAGVTAPPKTLSELQADALKLTVKNPDGSFKQMGFFPSFAYFEQVPGHFTSVFKLKWQTPTHNSDLAGDPGFTAMVQWQKSFRDAVLNQAPKSTDQQLTDFMDKSMAAGEFTSGQNPFETGAVAMSVDGEWRNANLKAETPSLSYGTAPFPTQDSDASSYGGGYLSGTVVGISSRSAHQDADWELVKYLTTNTDSLVTFANAIYNVPSTFAALASPKLTQDPNFQTFVKISGNADSMTTPASPNGGQYQQDAQSWLATWEAGQVSDLGSALSGLDHQIDKDTQAGSRPSGT